MDARGAVRVTESESSLSEEFALPSAQELEFLDRYGVHPDGKGRVEVPLGSVTWMERIAAAFQRRAGFVVLIDYGYTREQQLVGRHLDTVMTYRQHRAGSSVYEAPGEQDITAHVNFTALSSVAKSSGLKLVGLVTQSQFLLGIGEESQFGDAFDGCRLPQERAKVALQLRHLISPEGMGEIFQVLILSHNVAEEKAAHLSGLAFLR
jgi:SAM-dependent MidA family methyltransferase